MLPLYPPQILSFHCVRQFCDSWDRWAYNYIVSKHCVKIGLENSVAVKNAPACYRDPRWLEPEIFSKTQRASKQMVSKWQVSLFFKLGILVPVYFGTRLGVSLAAPKGVSKWMGIKMASSFWSFENLHFGARLFWYQFGCLQKNPKSTISGSSGVFFWHFRGIFWGSRISVQAVVFFRGGNSPAPAISGLCSRPGRSWNYSYVTSDITS